MRLARLPRPALDRGPSEPASQLIHNGPRLGNLEVSRWCFNGGAFLEEPPAQVVMQGLLETSEDFCLWDIESSKLSSKTPPGAGVGNIGIGG